MTATSPTLNSTLRLASSSFGDAAPTRGAGSASREPNLLRHPAGAESWDPPVLRPTRCPDKGTGLTDPAKRPVKYGVKAGAVEYRGCIAAATPARPGLHAHAQATRLDAPVLVKELRDLLGAKLVAYLGGVRETRAVRQ